MDYLEYDDTLFVVVQISSLEDHKDVHLVQMSKIDIIIENEATMYALSANVPKSYR